MRFPILIAVLLASACGPPGNRGAAPAGITGLWQSEGYGLVVDIADSSLAINEVTGVSCLARPDTLIRLSDQDGRTAFGQPGRDPTVFVLAGTDPNERRLHRPGTASDIVLRRLAARPAACDRDVPNTPPAVLNVFVETWNEHYILFDQKPVDWARAVSRARAAVNEGTPPDSLFRVLAGLIEPFEDAHTSVTAPDLGRVAGLRRGTDAAIPGGIARMRREGAPWFFAEVVPRLFGPVDRTLETPLVRRCNNQVQSGRLPGDVGYLRVLSFSGYADEGSYAAARRCLDAALDSTFADASAWKGLVIDVRINFGGSDALALGIAERLATAEYVAYRKEARADPEDRHRWTAPQPSMVRPSSRPGFRGPVALLTGPLTISAGETFTQALMGREPAVHRIGEHTQGVFSDVLGRRLPNGWSFGLPNEVFRTEDGRIFDGPGIPPHDTVPVFAPDDVRAGRDPALQRARSWLEANR